jgi:hypothetical protein
MRRAARRDTNEDTLVTIAEQLGALWVQTGPLDGWVLWRERYYPVEIKRPDGPKGGRSHRHYTAAQVLFIRRCTQAGGVVWTWRNQSDVLTCLNATVAA